MFSQQESLKKLQKPVRNKKGKVVKKKGQVILQDVYVPDYAKNDVTTMKIETFIDGSPEKQEEELTVFTRKSKPVKQVINMTQEAYDNMISKETPYNYRGELGPMWKNLSKNQRIKWHCMQIARSLGGEFESFQVLE